MRCVRLTPAGPSPGRSGGYPRPMTSPSAKSAPRYGAASWAHRCPPGCATRSPPATTHWRAGQARRLPSPCAPARPAKTPRGQVGRASCRGRGEISVGGGSFKKKKKENLEDWEFEGDDDELACKLCRV